MGEPEIDARSILLTEYEQLKQEQRTRIGFRDNLVYATLAALAGIVAAILSPRGSTTLLLLTPPVCIVLGWTYLSNDEKVSALGQYLRTTLADRVVRRSSLPADEVFGWEAIHRTDSGRSSRKWAQLTVDLATFCGAAAVALVLYWFVGPYSPLLLAVSLAELVAVSVLAGQFIRYADLGRFPPGTAGPDLAPPG